MKCPLFIMDDVQVQIGEETEIGDCIKDCAWWDKEYKECAILSIARYLRNIMRGLAK